MRVWLARPKLAPYAGHRQPPAPAGHRGLRVTWLGVSTLLFDDGDTAIMIDGFFTRPGLLRVVAGRIAPDPQTVTRSLRRAGVDSLAAVICAHSHYDHALDSPLVCELTGAVLVGSSSTANVGRGSGLPEDRLYVPAEGESLAFGAFTVTLIESVHSPHDRCPGTIDQPLMPPARAREWATGESYSILIGHHDRTILVQASANFIPGALAGHAADVVYLGVGTLGRLSPAFRARYWDEVVGASGARRIVPVHWDDFLRPLHQPLLPMRYAFDDFGAVMRFLLDRGSRTGVDVAVPVAWERTDPFAGLA
ncbi:MBL fold metallo-hydrolase [Streptomyces sp. KR80]|uniref:MBL fold metallo-hydrolase n=1 Tax=Streptomyces sp. KR80 TaxID=3457426 RepID=UPI003FD68C7E